MITENGRWNNVSVKLFSWLKIDSWDIKILHISIFSTF